MQIKTKVVENETRQLGYLAVEDGTGVQCPECETWLAGEAIPKHARFGYKVAIDRGRFPCRGWVDSVDWSQDGE